MTTGKIDPRYGDVSATAPPWTGAQEQKQRNLDSNPQVAITTGSTGANGWDSGKDIVVEGTALRVTNAEALQALADAWFAKYGEDWKFEVRGHEFVELSDSGGSTTAGPCRRPLN